MGGSEAPSPDPLPSLFHLFFLPPVLILLVCPGRQLRASCAGPSTPPAGSFLHKNTLKTIFCDCVGINMNVLSTRKVHFLPPHFRRKESTSVTLGQGSGWHRCLREPGPRCRLRERGRAVRPATDPSRRLKRLRLQGRSSSANMVGAGFRTPVLPRARRSDRGLGEQAAPESLMAVMGGIRPVRLTPGSCL